MIGVVTRRAERVMHVATAAAIGLAISGWLASQHVRGTPRALVPGAMPAAAKSRLPRDSIDAAAIATSDHDPFRLTHEPSEVPYTAEHVNAPPPTPPRLPPLTLSGIIGPPWVALLEGVPGHLGSLIAAQGDTVSRAPLAVLVLRRVSRDTAVLAAADTTWKLTVREPWP